MNFRKLINKRSTLVICFFVIFLFYVFFDSTRSREGQSYYSNFVIKGVTQTNLSYKNIFGTSRTKKSDVSRSGPLRKSTVEGWEFNTSRDTSLYILPENVTTVLLADKFCSSPTTLLIIICSSPGNFAIRNVIRETWALGKNNSNFSIDIYFLLGQVSNITLQEQIEQEFLEKNDVIQEHFIDSYNNLTIKSLMMLKLVKSHCLDNVKYLMKTDDDVYVNIPPLITFLRANGTKRLLAGYLMRGAAPVRDRKSKWYAPYYLYKGAKYPHYLSGTGYVMSIDVVNKLYMASFHTSIFYLEDVYITGILSEVVKLKPQDHAGFTYRKRDFNSCTYLTAITTHRLNETEIRDLHALIRKTDFQTCKRKAPTKSKFFSIFGLIDIYL